jgi:hypothetical protein
MHENDFRYASRPIKFPQDALMAKNEVPIGLSRR